MQDICVEIACFYEKNVNILIWLRFKEINVCNDFPLLLICASSFVVRQQNDREKIVDSYFVNQFAVSLPLKVSIIGRNRSLRLIVLQSEPCHAFDIEQIVFYFKITFKPFNSDTVKFNL